MSGGRGWLWLVPLALVVTGALAVAATWLGADRIESDLAGRARGALASAGLPGATVTFDGRDAAVSGVAPEQARRAADVVAAVEGVRTVESPGAPAREAPAQPRNPRDRLQAELDGVLAGQPITFQPDTAVLTPQGEQAVSDVVDVLGSAPTDLEFEVGGHVARVPGGDPRAARELSRQRADTVARRLIAAGIANDRVSAVGYGDTRPRTPTGDQSADRRVEITVRGGD
ncbi:OmpA family protein [Prauserella muralis]|uniref:Uncharacterized protein n=1 Tax=Prauserella muralis TaxID=588067 RepID=A0A2V4B732_9PSEU|nr:OmpA family protein [Prauserella muralis]PXY31037.1 hypothetical protein BAY60_01030 [Prauserella muralis]TWE14688.1 outer membrane protein OmpA-like peptidoglycan-associated protein [Prauserella muralis]